MLDRIHSVVRTDGLVWWNVLPSRGRIEQFDKMHFVDGLGTGGWIVACCLKKTPKNWFKNVEYRIDWSSLKHAHYWSIRLRDLTKSKKCPQKSFCQWGCFSSTCILNKLYFPVYFMCSYQHYATFSQFLSPLTIKMVWGNSLLWWISQAVHSSAAPFWYMLFWPREGSQRLWVAGHLATNPSAADSYIDLGE